MSSQICLVPKLSGLGGMASFQAKLIQGLKARQIPYSFDLGDPENTAVLVIGGTRHLWGLWRAKRGGARIVQRLNGMNWLHKVKQTPIPAAFKAQRDNLLLAFIRRFLATHIIYQSAFSRDWWTSQRGADRIPIHIVYNGVDLEKYSPQGPENPPEDHFRLLLVEGHITTASDQGLMTAVKLTQGLVKEHGLTVELIVVGDVDDILKAQAHSMAPDIWITWQGILPREDIPAVDRSAHLLFSADLNAACPNSVIEAMACGLPVAAYDTGALKELVKNGAGAIVPYGANHWQLEEPVIPPLANACKHIFENNAQYRQTARDRAETAFGLDPMVEAYLEVLVGS